ncbi:annexin A7-like [Clavelina lepadiformis]|uniref:annexin A7-like n=1 Tax=Clavelina lepadiformis TaxID=159417 RepID=UPI0040414EA6
MAKDIAKAMAEVSLDHCHGTVKDHSDFHAQGDAEVLRKAMKGLGTNEKLIIDITSTRSNKQRQEIKVAYKQAFGRDLMSDLKSELGGNFRDLALALFTLPAMYDARCLHDAMKGAGTTETTLVEILASRSNEQVNKIKEVYKKEYKKDLEKALTSETSGDFKKLLVSLCNAARDESSSVSDSQAVADAEALYKAGEKKLGTDEATFNRILCMRSFAQLRATFREYNKIAKKDIVQSIKSEFSGDAEDGLIAVADIARCAPAYFSNRLYHAMKGMGTKDSTLIRIVTTRAEIDMVEIKQIFPALHKSTLEKFIEGDTSGDYKKLLLALIK